MLLLVFATPGFAKVGKTCPKFIGVTPGYGSSFSKELRVTLRFDISDVLAEFPDETTLGIACSAGSTYVITDDDGTKRNVKSCARLFKGEFSPDKWDTDYIAETFTSRIDGTSPEFKVGATRFDVLFTGIDFEPGQTYTVALTLQPICSRQGETNMWGTWMSDWLRDPLVLSYVAEKVTDGVVLEDCTLINDRSLETPGDVTLKFNNDVTIDETKFVTLYDNFAKKTIAQLPLRKGADGDNFASVDFSGYHAYTGHTYTMTFPAGIVKNKADGTPNEEITRTFKGARKVYAKAAKVTPENGSTGIFSAFSVEFGIEDPDVFVGREDGDPTSWWGTAYIGDISNGETDAYQFKGVENADGSGLDFTWGGIVQPGTTYNFVLPKGTKHLMRKIDGKTKSEPAFWNDELVITYKAPTLEESGIPRMDFETPYVGSILKNVPFENGGKYDYIKTLELHEKGDQYEFNGVKASPSNPNPTTVRGLLYDVTDGQEVLVNDFGMHGYSREIDLYNSHHIIELYLDQTFYEGKRYKIVVPARSLGGNTNTMRNYWINDELVYYVEGTKSTEIPIASTSLKEGDVTHEITHFAVGFPGEFVLSEGKDISIVINTGKTTVTRTYTPTLSTYGANTYATIVTLDAKGDPYNLPTGHTACINVPEGLVYYAGDANICNKALSINIIGRSLADQMNDNFVKLTYDLNGHVTTLEAAKDRDMTLTLTPDSNWKVTSLTGSLPNSLVWNGAGGKNIKITPSEDVTVSATIEYAGPEMAVNQSTGIASTPDGLVKVYKEGTETIVIEGATSTIAIYTTSGLLIKTIEPEAGKDLIRVTVQPGQAYIVAVAGYAAKLM